MVTVWNPVIYPLGISKTQWLCSLLSNTIPLLRVLFQKPSTLWCHCQREKKEEKKWPSTQDCLFLLLSKPLLRPPLFHSSRWPLKVGFHWSGSHTLQAVTLASSSNWTTVKGHLKIITIGISKCIFQNPSQIYITYKTLSQVNPQKQSPHKHKTKPTYIMYTQASNTCRACLTSKCPKNLTPWLCFIFYTNMCQ